MPGKRVLLFALGALFLARLDAAGPLFRVNRVQVNIRADATAASTRIAVLGEGEVVEKLGEKDEWLRIRLEDGREGWVHSDLMLEHAAEEPELEPEPESEPELEPLPAAVRRNPYAEGLQQEAAGEYREATQSFQAALDEDPRNLNALAHLARAHLKLGEYSQAQGRLYQALAIDPARRDVLMTLAEFYRQAGVADSSAKYQALFRGEEWVPAPPQVEEEGEAEEEVPLLWIYGAAVGAAVLIAAVLVVGLRGQRRGSRAEEDQDQEEETPRGKFARAMRESRGRTPPAESGEAAELDRQIREKRQELRQSAEAFLGPGALAEGAEDRHLEQVLVHLETLRKALEAQDERAALYAEIVRLQNAKIEAMSRELQILRRRGRS